MSAEARLRYEVREELGQGAAAGRWLARGRLGGEVRADSDLRGYVEIASGDVSAGRRGAAPNFRNELSLQQFWLELPIGGGSRAAGAVIGRQEFDDAPKQLISVSDGPNIHRTWNGLRLYAKEKGMKFGAFAFRATQLGRHGFDEGVSRTERLAGITASLPIPGAGNALSLDPFWFRTEKSESARDTIGARFVGRHGRLSVDWTAAVQSGHYEARHVQAWAFFASQSLELTGWRWNPRLGLRIDAASGGGLDRDRPTGSFDQLYASSSYLGEGLFLSASNLFMVSPGLSFFPTARSKIAVDYGFARRLDERDAVYAGQMRPYPGTGTVAGHEIGGLFRIAFNWSASPRVVVGLDYEHLTRGDVLVRAHLPSQRYAHGSVSYRY